jgi:secondary thiamine-phosphate synthase enzyme
MSTVNVQRGEADLSNSSESATRPENPGTYRIFNRVIEWVTGERLELVNLTERINDLVRKSGVREGLVHVQSLHTTTAIFLNEWQDALLHDVKSHLEKMVDREQYWRHNDPQYSDCERSNADSHLRGMVMGQAVCLQVRNAKVLLGTWQNIIFAEFDGPRSRTLAVQISGI